MRISKQARREARELFRSCLADAVLDENRARQAVQLVSRDKPRGYLAVLVQFQRLIRLETARRAARVESAAPLPPDYRSQLQAELTRKYGAGLSFVFADNAALLAGLRIQVGGDVYEGSVQGRLAALQERF
jgi:F-type H+-transporting ATPase subunit delta